MDSREVNIVNLNGEQPQLNGDENQDNFETLEPLSDSNKFQRSNSLHIM